MDQYFQQMEKIVKQRKTSSRVRFMLQDVIELRHVSELTEIRSYFCCNVTINALSCDIYHTIQSSGKKSPLCYNTIACDDSSYPYLTTM